MVRSASFILAGSGGQVLRAPEEAYRGPIGRRAGGDPGRGPPMTLRTARPWRLGLAAALCASAAHAQAPAQPADLIVTHARVITLDATHPRATAVAVRAGNFVAVGADAEV